MLRASTSIIFQLLPDWSDKNMVSRLIFWLHFNLVFYQLSRRSLYVIVMHIAGRSVGSSESTMARRSSTPRAHEGGWDCRQRGRGPKTDSGVPQGAEGSGRTAVADLSILYHALKHALFTIHLR